jgi:hypothetical protein
VPGQSLYNFYGYVVDGVYKDFQDILNSPVDTRQKNNPIVTDADGTKHWSTDPTKYSRTNTVFVGDLKFKDINGDGVIDETDRTNIGSPMPKWTFGWNNTFRWKQWDLNIFINGSVGNKVGNYVKMKLTHMNSPWTNQLTDVSKRAILAPADGNYSGNWYDNIANVIVSNPSATLPRATINDPNDNDAWSDRYVESASYLRLKSITLGYTFKPELIHKIGLTNLRLTLNATNLFTITDYKGYEPEIQSGVDRGDYPASRNFTVGVELLF